MDAPAVLQRFVSRVLEIATHRDRASARSIFSVSLRSSRVLSSLTALALSGLILTLEKCGPPNLPLDAGATVLHQIVVMGNHVADEERMAFAITALDAAAGTHLRDRLLKSTALGWASRWGREDLVPLLLKRGADPLEKDAEPWATPLAWAVKRGHDNIAGILREYIAAMGTQPSP